VRKK